MVLNFILLFFDYSKSIKLFFRILFVFTLIFLTSCNSKNTVSIVDAQFETIYFDVVEKKTNYADNIPPEVKNLVEEWFNDKVKVNGLDGTFTFDLIRYQEDISDIINGKRVDISITFSALIDKYSLSQKKEINGVVNSFGSISGDFSLNDFEIVIQNTKSDLIERLTQDLKSKI